MKKRKHDRSYITWLFILQLTMLIYATTSIFSKGASGHAFLSVPFLLYYGGMIGVLGLYALLWQQVIKHLPLTLAYANKAVNVIWGAVFGVVLFGEKLNRLQILGLGVIILGTVLYVMADSSEKRKEKEHV